MKFAEGLRIFDFMSFIDDKCHQPTISIDLVDGIGDLFNQGLLSPSSMPKYFATFGTNQPGDSSSLNGK